MNYKKETLQLTKGNKNHLSMMITKIVSHDKWYPTVLYLYYLWEI
jgi:hypothetical protein